MWTQHCRESSPEETVETAGGNQYCCALEDCPSSEILVTAATFFPKLPNTDTRKMENHELPSSTHRVGLPKMSSNLMRPSTPQRGQTIHQHYQGETDALPTVWEERFSFVGDESGNLPFGDFQAQRTRSLYQMSRSHQGGQEPKQEFNSDGSYSQQYPTNQRLPKTRSCQLPGFVLSQGTRFLQLEQFRGLPLQVYRRLSEEISGMILTDYFGSGVTVARLQHDNIIELCHVHVIFATSSATDQCWLKAFTKKTRTQAGNVMKFSRLLTANISLEFCGKTAFLIGPLHGKASFTARTAEKHMFNFFEENEASRFIDALDKGKKQVWNHSVLRRKSQLDRAIRQSRMRQEMTFESTPRRSTNMMSVNRITDRPNTVSSTMVVEQDYYGDPQRGSSATGRFYEVCAAGVDPVSIRFRAPRVQVFVKVRTAYSLLGVGEISIVSTDEGHDNLVFTGTQGQVLCDHVIYSWNKPKVFQQNGTWECTWAAAVNLLIAINPRQMPSIREFKLVGNPDVVLKFIEALQQAASRALAKRITSSSAHNREPSTQQRLVSESKPMEKQGESASGQ